MKLKTLIKAIVIAIMSIFAICNIPTYAADSSYILGITNIRQDKGAYQIAPNGQVKKIWKIVSYPDTVSTAPNYSNAFYCIKAEHGFVVNNGTSVTDIRKLYDTKFNMKTQQKEVMDRLNAIDVFTTDKTSYNKILWIMDNMYLPNSNNANEEKQALLEAAGITQYQDGVLLTDSDIEVVQQLALWYFTNSKDSNYNSEELPILMFNNNSGIDGGYKSFADLYNDPFENNRVGQKRQYQAEDLYKYLIENADPNYEPQDQTSPISLQAGNFKIVQEGEKYIVGPLKIVVDKDRQYNISELKFIDENGKEIALTGENKLLNANKQEVSSGKIQDVIGQEFYISLPETTNIKTVNFSIKGSFNKKDATYYTTSASTYLQEQPVVLVEKVTQPFIGGAQVQIPEPKQMDLALRKFISAVNNIAPQINRAPKVDISNLASNKSTTAIYNHPKEPLSVKIGDIVTYTIRVYNEGEVDGYVSEITDHLPEHLEFLPDDEENIANGWIYDEKDSKLRTIKTNHLSKDIDTDNLLKAFDGKTLSYKDVKVKCKVKNTAIANKNITNIADITGFTDKYGKNKIDRDSKENNVNLPSDENLPNYKNDEISKKIEYIPGQQDDDDFEKVKVQIFDLALRKFITKVDNKNITNRIPNLSLDEKGNIKYTHTKQPVEVQTNNIVTYTLRIFNEGDIDGYAKEITDNLPEGLEYLPQHETNKQYRWIMIDEKGKQTTDVKKATKITTDYLSKEQEKQEGQNLIKAFNKQTGITNNNPDYKDVKVAFKVIEPNTSDKILTNIAEISEDADQNDDPVDDIDSTPGNNKPGEDDIDEEHVKLVYFDLALRKFITKVNNLDINNRNPQLSQDEKGNIKYTHTKEPVEVVQKDIVTYTLRIYNEGKMDGYAKEITDNLPQGLEYLPQHETNKQYRWIMLDKEGKQTTDVTKATKITTDYLSKEQEKQEGQNLIKAYNKQAGITDKNPDYKDVKVAFKVVEPNTSDRIIINIAEISEDADKNNDPVDDIDSTPGNDDPDEDDIDIEKVKVKYFDLALKKWVSTVIVIEDGKTTTTNTGHTGDENPEPVVKVDLKDKKLNKVTVKFGYKIKVTNEGQIEGYAKEVKDYIPDGLKFVAKDNPKWKALNEKEVVTTQLENTLLKPGQSATVDILLTWENHENNLGLKVNIAEISKDYNDSDTPDIDSTPNNKKPGEDDIDDAPVILSVKTGEVRMYLGIGIISLITLAGGIALIKKYVI